ncbi:MAG: glutathione S-transferase family protein [Gammaproteobacteria bacterium]
MNSLILHHFDASPFAEKVRVALGIKSLTWHSVQIPMVMPKPDLMPLTGGYRKTPVLQIGAEIYCDTSLILEEIETRFSTPALTSGGAAHNLAQWSDTTFFEPGAGLSMGLNPDLPEPILKDRKAFFNFMDFDQLKDDIPHLYDQYLAQVARVEEQLSDGRPFWAGIDPSMADILAYFPVWMARANVPGMDTLLREFKQMQAWSERMAAFGHGVVKPMEAVAALELAKNEEPKDGQGVTSTHTDLLAGDRVTVAPTDYGAVPVSGELITLNRQRITLRRRTPQTDAVNTHFPRSGYRVARI